MDSYNSRKDVPDKYKWDITDYCKDDKEFEIGLKEITKDIKVISKYKGCTKNANKLYEYITFSENVSNRLENLLIYAFLINDLELGNPVSIERYSKVNNVANEFSKKTAFFVPELLKLSNEQYDNLFVSNDKLNDYKKYLDLIFREKEHALNEEEEIIVTDLVNSMNQFDEMSSTLINSEHNYGTVLVDGKKETIALTNYRKLLKNKDSNLRKKVYTLFNRKLDEYSVSNAFYLNGYVKMQTSLARIYKFPSSWESKLFSLNMPNIAFENLRKTTEENVSSLQKYLELKAKVLGLEKLRSYDMNLELGVSNKKYTIEEAQEILIDALKPLGEDYIKHFRKIFDNKYIDYCQYKGKTSGAYSCSSVTNDSRILMSFNDDLDSVSTIAHEGGHNVHNQYVKANNPAIYRDVTTLVAEVASLTNEFLLSSYISDNASTKAEKLRGLENVLNVMVSNLFGAVREAKMEQDMYNHVFKGNTLTKEYLDKLSVKSLKKYYGDKVKLDKYSKNNWITRSHYYMHFYLYNYAICVSIASNVASEILKGNKTMLDNYIKFLSTGSDVWPIDSFKTLGVDLNKCDVYENAIKYFDSLVDKYNKIYEGKEV